MTDLGQRLADTGYALGWSVVKRLPEPVATAIFRRIADAVWRKRGGGVRQLEANLRRVLGPDATPERIREVSRLSMRSYLRYYQEAFRLPVWDRETVLNRMVCDLTLLDECSKRGKGAIFALPHTANWDHAGAWVTLKGYPFTTVAERLKPESLYKRFLDYRESLGMEVLPLTGGEGSTFGTLARRLREGRLLCLLSDRDLTAAGVPVTFFGEPTRMAAGPAALAVQTGAALIPVTLAFDGKVLRGTLHPEIEVPAEGTRREKIAAMTQSVADAYAAGIAASPQDWHMLQPLWLADLDERRLARIGHGEAQ
ncbi:phosphatidylinositol mannoside acyltransferase [Streptomyces sp. SID3343]|uniref:phosphatidylinositol mannoside acyltransferase n=1 Tax=Streptomyces sp. SID3343 TaxID=2690260 RepID=UPI00136951CB|nr:phosphatidylinositol mannoside acyltransferase [Streptomyces sp. SID3343]MYW05430.1 phosphatidylinositol mannoside acyltransferase [Streptomyces sp. SID3343]